MIARIIEFSARNRAARAARARPPPSWRRVYVLREIRLDALPDLSDTQVIVYSRWDRSPDIIEDQVTYPITSALLGAPKVKAVRGFSDFGFSYVYVIFEDGTDLYWAAVARHRVPVEDPGAAARRRQDRTRPRRDRRRLGLPVRAGRPHAARTTRTSCGRTRTGRSATRCRPCRAWRRWRRSAGSSSSTRSRSIRTGSRRYNLPLDQVVAAIRAEQQRGRRPADRVQRAASTWCAAAATRAASPTSSRSSSRPAPGGTPVLLRDIARVEIGPEIRRGVVGSRRPRRRRRRHRRHAPRRERAERHQPREGRGWRS